MKLIAHGMTVVGWMTEPFEPLEDPPEAGSGKKVSPKIWNQAVELSTDREKVKVTEQVNRLLVVHGEDKTCHLCAHFEEKPKGVVVNPGGAPSVPTPTPPTPPTP